MKLLLLKYSLETSSDDITPSYTKFDITLYLTEHIDHPY